MNWIKAFTQSPDGLLHALATTTLASAVLITDNSIVVAAATSIAAGRLIRIDDEWMQVAKNWVSGTTIPVYRGQDGSSTSAHVTGANVTHGTSADFQLPGAGIGEATTTPGQRPRLLVSITATSTLALPTRGSDLFVVLNGTSVITLTIPVPTKDMDGTVLTIAGNGAAAHVLTFTSGLGGAGGSYDAVTINATAPAAFQAVACNGLWLPIFGPAMTGTVTNLTGGVA